MAHKKDADMQSNGRVCAHMVRVPACPRKHLAKAAQAAQHAFLGGFARGAAAALPALCALGAVGEAGPFAGSSWKGREKRKGGGGGKGGGKQMRC